MKAISDARNAIDCLILPKRCRHMPMSTQKVEANYTAWWSCTDQTGSRPGLHRLSTWTRSDYRTRMDKRAEAEVVRQRMWD